MGVLPVVTKLTAIHVAVIFFLGGLFIATILLGVQYIFKYRKYHIAMADDQDSLTDPCATLAIKNRAMSNSTLLTEVISLTRLRSNVRSRNKHSRLRESVEHEPEEREATLAKEEDSLTDSTQTLTQGETTTTTAIMAATNSEVNSLPCSLLSEMGTSLRRPSVTCLDKDHTTEKEEKEGDGERRLSNVSTVTLTKVRANSTNRRSTSDPIRSGEYLKALIHLSFP